MSIFDNTHPELTRIGIKLENVDARYKPLMRMGISIDEMIYLARRLYPLIKGGKRALDLACGNGLITVILSKFMSDSEFHAIDDWSKVSRDELIRNIEIDKAKITLEGFKENYNLPYQDNYFDVVYAVQILARMVGLR
ncbi:MAG: class I SAM-dependent methyltransferase [Saccharolobus sp.]|uniref:class I SAM-dependent methyltransferase n=1 Tax=Saccharolobus TaxID=2100760 RepID=UPI001F0F173A|nr:class I SAM-dependent methyltransferase [Saccharolobus shibatae]MCH4816776.1 class I SAM-dependent methyltransferase [Saccharolobus shibatae]